MFKTTFSHRRAGLTGALSRCSAALVLGLCCLWGPRAAAAAGADASIPAIIQKGLNFYVSGGAEPAVTAWREGGMLEADNRARDQMDRLKQIASPLGTYKGCEVIEAKTVGAHSRILYLSLLFERGAIYTRFLLYRTPKDWVVQHLELNTRPEAVMPWLAMEKEP